MQQTGTSNGVSGGGKNDVLILASASPRRRMLLEGAGYRVRICPAHIPEIARVDEPPVDLVQRLARAKAWTVAPMHPRQVVVGADTIVLHDDAVLGKPASLADARAMLRRLSGTTHRVLTGVCICRRTPRLDHAWTCTTRVTFNELDDSVITDYLRQVDVLDKAGAYGIQEHGDMLVADIDGSLSNVIGLPVEELARALDALG